MYFCRLEYTRQDNSKKQEIGVDGPSPDLRVRLSVIFTLTKMSLDGSSAVKTLLAPCVLGILRGGGGGLKQVTSKREGADRDCGF